MTQADKCFINTCKEIIEHGYSSEGTGVRTRWEDGTEANYYSMVGVQNKYDLEKDKLVSAIMTSNFHANDSVFADLTEEADSFMDSMVALEAKITQTMQESKVHQKVKM